MVEGMGLWCGFCFVTFHKKEEGEAGRMQYFSLLSEGQPRDTVGSAWQEALEHEARLGRYLRDIEGVRATSVITGVAPAGLAP